MIEWVPMAVLLLRDLDIDGRRVGKGCYFVAARDGGVFLELDGGVLEVESDEYKVLAWRLK